MIKGKHFALDGLAGETAVRNPVRQILRRSLHDEVIEQLREMIVEGELTPGDRISEKELCERFGISRTPLREALKVLASEELIELQPNRGARVSQITTDDVRERFEVLSALERQAGELAATRASDADIARFGEMHRRMMQHYRNGERHEYFMLNHRIHNTLIEFAHNSVLTATHASLMVRVRRPRFQAILSQERWDESVREHEAILAALRARDGRRLGELIYQHVSHTGAALCQGLTTTNSNCNA